MALPVDRSVDRAWLGEAIRIVEADSVRSPDTHIQPIAVATPGVDVYLKDESIHPTGSLKHRLARSLFLHALCNGWLAQGTTVVEASSGSTAVSEAYFARLIGLPFVAVMPRSTSRQKVALIERYGGRCHFVNDSGAVYAEAERLAAETGGHYLDQFTFAERATDWRGNNNIAEAIFAQMSAESHPVPTWVIVGAGTGGTSATIGRYIRYRRLATQLLVADPENSVFEPAWRTGRSDLTGSRSSRIEGIGRPRVEPSFVPQVVDDMVRVPDAGSMAAMLWVSERIGRAVGPSTGTNIWATLVTAARMRETDRTGSIVTLLCDGGERYQDTCFDESWRVSNGIDVAPYLQALQEYGQGVTGALLGLHNRAQAGT